MLGLSLQNRGPVRLLVVGAHADDIEIGCGATLLRMLRDHAVTEVDWVVASANDERREEAESSAQAYLDGACRARVHTWGFRDGFLPYEGAGVKARFEALKAEVRPDVVLTHYRADRHQDHRLVSELTWNTFRDAVVLEYEIPKWDGDLGTPNLYVAAEEDLARRKVALLNEHFPSQRTRDWFDDETFLSMMRLRGMECRSPSRLAEAFYAHKLVFDPASRGFCS